MCGYLNLPKKVTITLTLLMFSVSCGKKSASEEAPGEETSSESDPTSVTDSIEGAEGGAVNGASQPFPTSPSVSSLSLGAPESLSILEDETAHNLPFTFKDDVDLVACTSVNGKSNNTLLIDHGQIVIGGTAPNCTITLTPNLNQFGTARVTLMASDKLGNFVTSSFEVVVTSVDDKPSLSKVLDQTTAKNQVLSGIAVNITDPDSVLTCSGSLTVTSSNPLILSQSGISVSGDAPSCNLNLTPVPNAVGSSTITLSLGEGASLVSDFFTFTVSQTFAPPSLTAPSIQSLNEDQSLSNIGFLLQDADGDANCLDVLVSTNPTTIFGPENFTLGGSAPNCSISFAPKANQSGDTLVTLSYTDPTSLTTSSNFTITVAPINDPPSLAVIDHVTLQENASLSGHPIVVEDIDSSLSCSSALSGTVTDETKVASSALTFSGVAPNCQLSLTPITNAYGSTSISVTVSDGEFSASRSFNLNLTRNSVPSVPVLADSSPVISNSSSLVVNGTCTAGLQVRLSGNVVAAEVTAPANSLNQTCSSGSFSYTIQKTSDGSFSFALKQVHGSVESPLVYKNWIRDTLKPVAPMITNPTNLSYSSGPTTLLLQGNCELNSNVTISRNGTGLTPVTPCVGGSFSRSLMEGLDGLFNYSITQQDAAGNISEATLLAWDVDSTVPANPVLIQNPVNYTTSNQFLISGSCSANNNVYIQLLNIDIAGSPLTCSAGAFSLSTSQSSDGIYEYAVFQEDINNELISGSVNTTWIKDSVAPSAPEVTYPTALYSSSASITIRSTCESGATVFLKEDGVALDIGSSNLCSGGLFEHSLVKSDLLPTTYVYLSITHKFNWLKEYRSFLQSIFF